MINATFKDRLIGILVVPMILLMVVASYSLLIGWTLASMLVFWYLLVPVLTVGVSWRLLKDRNPVWVPLLGLAIFYVGMVFMIYDHYQTDYFRIMLLSLAINGALVTGVMLAAVPSSRAR